MGIYDMTDLIIDPTRYPWGYPFFEWPAGVNGTFWTVGVDKQFLNIADAISVAESGDTILVYPGTYNHHAHFGDKRVHLRGMGATANDVFFNQGAVGNTLSYSGVNEDNFLYIENIRTQQTSSSWHNFNINSFGSSTIVHVNKCSLSSASTAVNVYNQYLSSATVHFSNCFFAKGYRHIYNYTDGLITWNKILTNDNISYRDSTKTVVNPDYVLSAAEGYGHTYGEFFIKTEWLKFLGY